MEGHAIAGTGSAKTGISVAIVAAALCCGCIMQGARKTYLAEWQGAVPAAEEPAARPAVRVGPVAAAEPYASTRMLVWEENTGRLRGTKGSQFATPPAVFVQAAVVRALELSGAFEGVADSSLSSGGGTALRGFVEKARLEKRTDGTTAYALRVSFFWSDSASGNRNFASCEKSVPAAGEDAADQARAAAEAAGAVASEILGKLLGK